MGNSGGRFVWYELATTDIEAAKAFYAGVLGWGTGDASMPGSVYTLFTAGDAPVAGLMKLPADAPLGPAVVQILERSLETVKRPLQRDLGILIHVVSKLRITKFHA